MSELVVPVIPEAVKNKTFGASDIKWVKTVNDDDPNKGVTYCSAYIYLNNQKTKCFTHLVTPIDNNVILKPYNPNNPDDIWNRFQP
jgi:hypothetical protein